MPLTQMRPDASGSDGRGCARNCPRALVSLEKMMSPMLIPQTQASRQAASQLGFYSRPSAGTAESMTPSGAAIFAKVGRPSRSDEISLGAG